MKQMLVRVKVYAASLITGVVAIGFYSALHSSPDAACPDKMIACAIYGFLLAIALEALTQC